MAEPLPYDKKDPFSIERYAKKLLDTSLRALYGNVVTSGKGKGNFGNLIEQVHFQYKPNSVSQPDFPEAGVELKTTPLKKIGKGLVSKERLVFNMIDFENDHIGHFRKSSFWKKNSLLLLMFYLYERDELNVDHLFKIIRLWRFPSKDLKIIIDDWNKIIQKIRDGKAHEISESDTLYLGACTKGVNKGSLRKQPFSDIPAMRRAYSLKQNYINFIIQETLHKGEILADDSEYESILQEPLGSYETLAAEPSGLYGKKLLKEVEAVVKDVSEYKPEETFEELVIRKFKPYYGCSEKELIKEFALDVDAKAKAKFEVIAKAILGVRKKRIEEFEKADVLMKTIRIEFNGSIKESMSFRQIQYKEIIKEDWLGSTWYEELNRRFFFVVFQADDRGEYRLKKVKFWSIPSNDMATLEKVWSDTKRRISKGDFDHFIKASDERIGHVRPKALNAQDLMEAPDGSMQKKKCFWLNGSYIKKVVSYSQEG